MRKHMVLDGLRPVDFTGVLLAEKSTRSAGRLRWTELALYRMAGEDQHPPEGAGDEYPSGAYVLTSLGASLVYHRGEGGCDRSRRCDPGRAGDLPPGFAPCEECWPVAERWPGDGDDPTELAPGDMCRPERNRPKAVVCAGAGDVEGTLRDWSGSRKVRASRLSGPAQDLLEEASKVDEDIRRMITEEVHL